MMRLLIQALEFGDEEGKWKAALTAIYIPLSGELFICILCVKATITLGLENEHVVIFHARNL